MEEGKGMTGELVMKKQSETAEIHKTRCLKIQSENLNEDIQNVPCPLRAMVYATLFKLAIRHFEM